jgi:cytidine deaminase
VTNRELLELAIEAREMAYAPYSGFRVGAALVGKSGKIYKGCNVENAAYSPTNCAERTAIFKAVSEGEREFNAIAIVGGMGETIADFCAPCGVCRQVLAEFCGPDFRVV